MEPQLLEQAIRETIERAFDSSDENLDAREVPESEFIVLPMRVKAFADRNPITFQVCWGATFDMLVLVGVRSRTSHHAVARLCSSSELDWQHDSWPQAESRLLADMRKDPCVYLTAPVAFNPANPLLVTFDVDASLGPIEIAFVGHRIRDDRVALALQRIELAERHLADVRRVLLGEHPRQSPFPVTVPGTTGPVDESEDGQAKPE